VRTIAIINQKGGCGKTTSAINLSGCLAREGYRTLLVDMDPQSHCAAGLAIPEQRIDLDIGDAMLLPSDRHFDAQRLLWRVSRDLDLAPSRMKLAGLEAARGGLAELPDKQRRLAQLLRRFEGQYDVCCIDCSPSIGLLTFNALIAADAVLIPVETSFFSLQGATKQLNTVRSLSRRLGVDIPSWFLPTIHDPESHLARDLLEELRRRAPANVCDVAIRVDPALKESASFGQPIINYAPHAPGAEDYASLAHWLIRLMSLDHHRALREQQPVAPAPSEAFDGDGEGDPPTVEMPHAGTTDPTSALAQVLSEHASHADPTDRARELAERAGDLQRRLAALADRKPSTIEETKPAPARTDERILGAREVGSGVLFVQPLHAGERVAVAGHFNDWSTTSHVMRRNDHLGVHELVIPLTDGAHAYRLFVDGRWTTDPFNPESEVNAYGERDSIVRVESRGETVTTSEGHDERHEKD